MFSHQSTLRRLVPLALLSSLLVAVAPAQKVYAWGDNGVGQTNVPGVVQGNTVAVKAGYYFSVALKADGGVVAWGDNSYGELNIPVAAQSGVSSVAAGVLHTLALKNGGIIAWGSNERGETNVPAAALSGVTGMAAGEYCSLAIKDGGVIGWGNNDYGLMNIPVAAQSGVSKIACGSYHALALKNGGIIGWGFNVAGSLDIPGAAQSGVVSMACGYLHSLALKTDGSVVAWGWNNMGQCNVPVAAQSGVIAVAGGYDFSMALKEDGSIVAWGDNDYGWLNIPSDVNPSIAISASAYHTMALKPAAWATLDQTEVYAGDAATGTVHLANPAGAGGVQVNLVSDNPVVHVPAWAIVPEGATEATFPVTTDTNYSQLTVRVQTSYNGTATLPFKLKVKGTPLTFTPNHTSIVGGSTTPMSFVLSAATTSPNPTVFALSSSNAGILSAPASVTLPAGQNSVTVPLTHNLVPGSATTVTLTASYAGSPAGTTDIVVQPFSATVTLESTTITAGDSTYAFVTLNATPRAALTISTGGSDAKVSMPATVKINGGARTGFFPISTNVTTVPYVYPVKVIINGKEFSTSLRVQALPSVSGILLPTVLTGNTKVLATLKLNKPAGAGGQVVSLSATDGLSVPDSITVPEGLTTATFDVTPSDVEVTTTAHITAAGYANQTVRSVSIRPLLPASLTLHATNAKSDTTFTITVALRSTPTEDTEVAIASNNPLVNVPATVTVLAGTNSVDFTATVSTVTRPKPVQITATKNGKVLAKNIVAIP